MSETHAVDHKAEYNEMANGNGNGNGASLSRQVTVTLSSEQYANPADRRKTTTPQS